MTTRDLNNIESVSSIQPQVLTADATGAGVDLRGFDSARVLVHAGTFTDGTITPSVEESDDNSTFTAVAADDLLGAFPAITTANDARTHEVRYRGNKRYIRVFADETVATAGAPLSASVIRGHPHVSEPARA